MEAPNMQTLRSNSDATFLSWEEDETYAYRKDWAGVIIEKHGDWEDIYDMNQPPSKELNYPSIHKEILTVKNTINHFRMYLKTIKFVIIINSKIMP